MQMTEKNLLSSSVRDASATVKIKFNELDKSELLQMLAFLQSELEAIEVVIAAMKSEKCKHLLYQAKYGRLNATLVSSKGISDISSDNWNGVSTDSIFVTYDPFVAMQRDIQYVVSGTDQTADSSVESNLKPVYDSQLHQLENLISSQKKAQLKMKEQILYLEKKSVKLTEALEDERNKHERDAAQGDDVLVMLEKERERLKSALDYEKSHCRKLERELKRLVAVIEEQKTVIQNQRLAASVIMKTKKQIESDLRAANVIINESENITDLIASDLTTIHNVEVSDNLSNNPVNYLNTNKSGVESTACQKDYTTAKLIKQNIHEAQSVLTSDPKSKELNSHTSMIVSEPIVTITNPVVIPIQKSRNGKQPESLLWQTYDPKNSLPTTTIAHNFISLSTKSPSNIRRQLPNASLSNSSFVASLSRHNLSSAPSSIITSSAAITPYQKILSTPPPNSIINQTASFQSSLTSYGLFNMGTPSLPSHASTSASGMVHKLTVSTTKTDVVNSQPFATHSARSRQVINPIVTTSSSVHSPLIRSGDTSPVVQKHIYVNGK